MVEEDIKFLVAHVEDKMKYKVDRIHTLTKGLKIVSSNQELDTRRRERNIKRTPAEIAKLTKKKIRVKMMRVNQPDP